MQWIAIAGGWKHINSDVERDVRATVRDIIKRGDGIITGGALGVDYIAVDEALIHDPAASQIQVLLPSELAYYILDLETHIGEHLATEESIEKLIFQLEKLKDRTALVEGFETQLNKEIYFSRIKDIIENADALVAFHINETEGTQATIDAAHKKGIPVQTFSYAID